MHQDEGYISDFSLFDGCLIEAPDLMNIQLSTVNLIPGFPDRMGMEHIPYTLGQENVSCSIKEKEK